MSTTAESVSSADVEAGVLRSWSVAPLLLRLHSS